MGNKYGFNGTIHEIVPDQKITRTFEQENAFFPVQLEFLEFESLTYGTSQLSIKLFLKRLPTVMHF